MANKKESKVTEKKPKDKTIPLSQMRPDADLLEQGFDTREYYKKKEK